MAIAFCENCLFADDKCIAAFGDPIQDVGKCGDVLIVLLAPSRGKDSTRNVYGVVPGTGVVWQIQEFAANANPPSTYTGFIHRDRSERTVWIANWSGLSVEVDPGTGAIHNFEESR